MYTSDFQIAASFTTLNKMLLNVIATLNKMLLNVIAFRIHSLASKLALCTFLSPFHSILFYSIKCGNVGWLFAQHTLRGSCSGDRQFFQFSLSIRSDKKDSDLYN